MDLRLDSDGDLFVGDDGKLALVDGAEAVKQQLDIRLKLFKGEWFADLAVGMPYHESIFGKGRSLTVIQGIFRKAVLTCPGVASVGKLALDYDAVTRALSVNLLATTDTGATLDYSQRFAV